IVVAGESLVDLLVRPDGGVTATPGGGPFNVARALGRLGLPVAYLGRLSTDPFGRLLRARLVADGVDLGLTPTTDDPTLLAVVEIDDDGTATYRFHAIGSAAVGLGPRDVANGLPVETTALHIGTLGLVLEPMASTIAGLVATAPPGVLVMADPNCRPSAIADPAAYRSRLATLMRRVDVVKLSADDLAWLDPERDVVDASRAILESGPAVVLLTDGGHPTRIVTRRHVVEVAVPEVTVVDTVGAGDAFGAGFLAAWTRAGRGRLELEDLDAVNDATRFAIEVGAVTVGRAGADPPTLAELGASAQT
ncbi:MAG TPA: carbohydrate kinase, partial [Candidatus Limnocylindrales bacterium]|nr:carbohydrate kinase [Candidatus Limnocylindrales bacterium]